MAKQSSILDSEHSSVWCARSSRDRVPSCSRTSSLEAIYVRSQPPSLDLVSSFGSQTSLNVVTEATSRPEIPGPRTTTRARGFSIFRARNNPADSQTTNSITTTIPLEQLRPSSSSSSESCRDGEMSPQSPQSLLRSFSSRMRKVSNAQVHLPSGVSTARTSSSLAVENRPFNPRPSSCCGQLSDLDSPDLESEHIEELDDITVEASRIAMQLSLRKK